jgi:NAD(P)-dependent dehydrogenase (short-subunit alcohol dehydrogenase family)
VDEKDISPSKELVPMTSQWNLENRVVLVAGGTGGLGSEVSMAFADAGARTVATYRLSDEFAALTAEASRAGRAAPTGVLVDTTDAEAVAAMVDKLVADHGRLDILVNAVGGYSGGKNLWEEDSSTFARMMSLNVLSGFVLARAAVPAMIRQNRGSIVSIASRAGYGHAGGTALYAASKAAALALFDSLAEEVKPYAINVNSVVPSIFDTPANRRAMPAADYSLWPKPADIARVILFLCSDDARLIHGAAIPVYGRT